MIRAYYDQNCTQADKAHAYGCVALFKLAPLPDPIFTSAPDVTSAYGTHGRFAPFSIKVHLIR